MLAWLILFPLALAFAASAATTARHAPAAGHHAAATPSHPGFAPFERDNDAVASTACVGCAPSSNWTSGRLGETVLAPDLPVTGRHAAPTPHVDHGAMRHGPPPAASAAPPQATDHAAMGHGPATSDMAMMMGDRDPGERSHIQLRAMGSLEPAMGARGYSNIFAVGEVADDRPLVDRQHPHDLFTEPSARVEHRLGSGDSLFLRGGPGVGAERVRPPGVGALSAARADHASLTRLVAHHLRRGDGRVRRAALAAGGVGL